MHRGTAIRIASWIAHGGREDCLDVFWLGATTLEKSATAGNETN